MDSLSTFYLLMSVFFVLSDIYVGVIALKNRNEKAKFLGITCFLAAGISTSYFLSIASRDYRLVSATSSLYFLGYDWMLIYRLKFLVIYTNYKVTKRAHRLFEICKIYAIAESVMFIANVFYEFELTYIPRDAAVAHYVYDFMPPYYMHLGFTYGLVVVLVYLLALRSHRAPMQYKNKYIYPIIEIIAIVAVNAVFLFIRDNHFWNYIDVSVLGFSLILFVLYWCAFIYSENDMIKGLSQMIFDNLTQGIVLFDYENNLVMKNDMAEKLLSFVSFRTEMKMDEFVSQCGIPEENSDKYTVQFYAPVQRGAYPVRCDFIRMLNKRRKIIGNAFVFTDAALETDLLTGFENWDSYVRVESSVCRLNYTSATAIVFDINNLSQINANEGKEEGDRIIRTLSMNMTDILPHNTIFIRGRDAHLIAICYDQREINLKEYITQIMEKQNNNLQYGMSELRKEDTNPLAAIERAERAMRIKKLIDRRTTHSRLLTSLVKALQESDNDTEAHVQRTQKMGAVLARKMNFSDLQKSQLSLLCLLHDIGKIGIPLEILNKPGKLSDEEWNVLKTHVDKGYQIARSSRELSDIAEMILYHHERWDGKGYPKGIAAEDIPVLSRVISVVDSYDAMVNNRSYRRAMTPEQAQEELVRCSGTQFDPNTVNAFIEMLKDYPELAIGEKTGRDTYVQSVIYADITEKTESPHMSHVVNYARYVADKNSRIVLIDDIFTQITGYTKEDISTRVITQFDMLPPEDYDDYMQTIQKRLESKTTAFIEHRIVKKDGTKAYVYCIGKNYYDSAVMEERTEVLIADVSSSYVVRTLTSGQSTIKSPRRKKERLTSNIHPVDFNTFKEQVATRITDKDFSVMMLSIEIDKFSDYIELHGEKSGEEYLVMLSHTLQNSLRYEDIACRYSDDKFVAALFFKKGINNATMKNRASQIFDKLNLSLNKFESGTSVSMGVSIQSSSRDTFDALYYRADNALNSSKNIGTCRLTISDD